MFSRRTLAKSALGSVIALALGRATAATASPVAKLFEPLKVASLQLPNRIAMAPMTRGRAGVTRTANALMAEYYAQRADAGLLITEAAPVSAQGYGWAGSPAIYTDSHVAGWKLVTDAVHRKGGRIFLQLWHMGRVSHPDFLDGETPVSASAIAATGSSYTPSGKKPYVTPRAMTVDEIAGTVQAYAQATTRARDAGFDGVEVHAANGYLIDQFIRDGSNQRTDQYGGSVDNRLRFLLEVVAATTRVWSAQRIGVRLSPLNPYNSMADSQPAVTFTQAAKALNGLGLAYLHVFEDLTPGRTAGRIAPSMRAAFKGTFILNGGYDARTGAAALDAGEADLIAYGKPYLANPDLVERYRSGAPLNTPDVKTFYTDGKQGYTDYPRLKT